MVSKVIAAVGAGSQRTTVVSEEVWAAVFLPKTNSV